MNNWIFTEDKELWLKTLSQCYAPSSNEMRVQQLLAERFEQEGIACYGDAIGNLYASSKVSSGLRIGIVAHSDEVGLQITDIDDDGLLRFRKIGGLRATSLIGHKVVVLTDNGEVEGIVGCDPLQDNGTDTGILVKTSDLWIDVGAESKEECESKVQIGDFVLFRGDFSRLGKHRLVGKALDNRLGGFVMSEVVSACVKKSLKVDVVAVSTVQEEINMGGISACREPLDIVIVVDVDFATDIPTEHKSMGRLSIGEGVGINYNADSNKVLQEIFCKVAMQKNIPVQATLSRNISGGTDAVVARTLGNIATLNVNIPLRYMHSHCEMCDVRDIESAVNSIVGLIEHISDNNIINFVPWKQ